MSNDSALFRELQTKPLTRRLIAMLKARSLRQGIWFRVLESHERGLVDASLGWVHVVRSDRLKRVLAGILSKVATKSYGPLKTLGDRGRRIARRISELAVRWGNSSAWIWRSDVSFQVYIRNGIAGRSMRFLRSQSPTSGSLGL